MQITKRNLETVDFNPSKIYNRLKKSAVGLKNVDIDKVFINLQNSIIDGISTKQIDELAAQTAFSFNSLHSDYSKLAANIAISRHHKESYNDLGELYEILYSYKNEYGEPKPLISEKIYNKYKENKELIDNTLNESLKNEFNMDYYQWVRVYNSYLIKIPNSDIKTGEDNFKIVERFNQMLMRVALTVYENIEDCITLFKECLANEKLISYGSPVHMNAGTILNQMVSCNLSIVKEDSREGLLETHNNIAKASSQGEGIGLHVSNIRSAHSTIASSGGNSGGVMKYLKMINENLRFFDQGGKRESKAAIYIEPWHRDLFDVIDVRKNFGKDEMRARSLFPALWMPDLFFKRLKEDSYWTLMCPNEILLYYKRKGIKGKKPLYRLYGEEFEKEYIALEEAVLAGELKKSIIKTANYVWDYILRNQIETGTPFMLLKDSANRKSNQKNIGTLTGSNLCLAGDTKVIALIDGDYVKDEKGIEKESLPLDFVVASFRNGHRVDVYSFNEKTKTMEFKRVTNAALMNKSAKVLKVKDLLFDNELICTPDHKIFTYNRGWVIANDLTEYDHLEFCDNVSQAEQDTKTLSILELIRQVPVYDLTVEDNHNFYANGILVHNCTEILEVVDSNTIATCTLASLVVKNMVDIKNKRFDFNKLAKAVKHIVYTLNNVIDLNSYSTKEAENGGKSQRALGIGVQGLADVYMMLDLAWSSDEAAKLERQVYEHVYYNALKYSNELAIEKGLIYDAFEGSDFSKGILQFDHWDNVKFSIPVEKWNELKESIVKNGIANSLLTTQMPNALSSHVNKSEEGFQPINSNLYVRSVAQGDFKVCSNYLQNDMEKYGLWNDWFRAQLIDKEGSIQNIDFSEYINKGIITKEQVNHLKEKHKTIFEIKLNTQIKRSRNRAPFIDQTQSFNLHLAKPDINVLAKAILLGVELDLKTLCYYVKSTAVSTGAKDLAISLEPTIAKLSDNEIVCDNCGS